ncbi:hypothetical protein JYT51_02440, partial [Candidatus Amoebophilus asiaticus]|nr:hypothetical protein [Candidatus Amoebophilus asiaticus]
GKDTSTTKSENNMLLKEAEKIRNANLDYLINSRIEKVEKKAEKDIEKAKKDIENKIRIENIVISAHPELIEIFKLYCNHYKDKGKVKEEKQMIQNYLYNQWVWGRTPEFDKELWKKAMQGRKH